jgi:hypothetical protein
MDEARRRNERLIDGHHTRQRESFHDGLALKRGDRIKFYVATSARSADGGARRRRIAGTRQTKMGCCYSSARRSISTIQCCGPSPPRIRWRSPVGRGPRTAAPDWRIHFAQASRLLASWESEAIERGEVRGGPSAWRCSPNNARGVTPFSGSWVATLTLPASARPLNIRPRPR